MTQCTLLVHKQLQERKDQAPRYCTYWTRYSRCTFRIKSTGSTNKPGVIRLSWTNATDYIESKDSTEIWRASSQGSSGDITSHATLLGVIDGATTFTDAVGDAGTFIIG